jgi:hypothetical protein
MALFQRHHLFRKNLVFVSSPRLSRARLALSRPYSKIGGGSIVRISFFLRALRSLPVAHACACCCCSRADGCCCLHGCARRKGSAPLAPPRRPRLCCAQPPPTHDRSPARPSAFRITKLPPHASSHTRPLETICALSPPLVGFVRRFLVFFFDGRDEGATKRSERRRALGGVCRLRISADVEARSRETRHATASTARSCV